jgi:hypothetical protein
MPQEKKNTAPPLSLKMGLICSTETSVSNHLTRRNNPEDRQISFNHCGSVRSCIRTTNSEKCALNHFYTLPVRPNRPISLAGGRTGGGGGLVYRSYVYAFLAGDRFCCPTEYEFFQLSRNPTCFLKTISALFHWILWFSSEKSSGTIEIIHKEENRITRKPKESLFIRTTKPIVGKPSLHVSPFLHRCGVTESALLLFVTPAFWLVF